MSDGEMHNQRRDKITYKFKGEKYKIWDYLIPTKMLGQGAFSFVIEAKDKRFKGHRVAIQKNKNVFADLDDTKRILKEIQLLMAFDHDDIIKIIDVIPPDTKEIGTFNDIKVIYPRMQTTLKRIIECNQKLGNQHYLFFMYQILRGLQYIHSFGIVHRNIRPENILVNAKNCNVKISDFNLARVGNFCPENSLTELLVTRWYTAPEVLVCAKQYGSNVDVWSCGCIFAELLLRRELFPGNNHFEQLTLIFSMLGTEQKLDWVKSTDAREWISNLEFQRGHDLRKIFKNGKPEAIELISQMLTINPHKRINCNQALNHPYFAKLHQNEKHHDTKKSDMKFIKTMKRLQNYGLLPIDYVTLVRGYIHEFEDEFLFTYPVPKGIINIIIEIVSNLFMDNGKLNNLYSARHAVYKTLSNFNNSNKYNPPLCIKNHSSVQ